LSLANLLRSEEEIRKSLVRFALHAWQTARRPDEVLVTGDPARAPRTRPDSTIWRS